MKIVHLDKYNLYIYKSKFTDSVRSAYLLMIKEV